MRDRISKTGFFLVELFDLVEFQFDRGLTTEHLNDNAGFLFVRINLVHDAEEGFERTADDLYVVADFDIEHFTGDHI